jgi:hypothetical protein
MLRLSAAVYGFSLGGMGAKPIDYVIAVTPNMYKSPASVGLFLDIVVL